MLAKIHRCIVSFISNNWTNLQADYFSVISIIFSNIALLLLWGSSWNSNSPHWCLTLCGNIGLFIVTALNSLSLMIRTHRQKFPTVYMLLECILKVWRDMTGERGARSTGAVQDHRKNENQISFGISPQKRAKLCPGRDFIFPGTPAGYA